MIYGICNVETGELLQVSEDALSVSGHPLQVRTLMETTQGSLAAQSLFHVKQTNNP